MGRQTSTGAESVDPSFDDALVVTPSDTVAFATRLRAVRGLWADVAGTVRVITERQANYSDQMGTVLQASALGSVLFNANPANGQTVVLNGVTWTFVTSGATGTQTNIGASLAATLTQLATDLNASANSSINVASYTVDGTHLFVTYKTVGAGGNAYTLAAGTTGSTPSGATLTGGVDKSVSFTVLAGQVLPLRVAYVLSTGTAATGIKALF